MEESQLYKEFNSEELEILDELLNNKYSSRMHISNNYINNSTRRWLAIYADYLTKHDKRIILSSSRYYFKQDDLDSYYPTSASSTRIASPFSYTAAEAELQLHFIDTTTGKKIYEYASQLCKVGETYKNRQSLSVSLTQDKMHKVMLVQSGNTLFILSNNINEQLVEQTLALLPFAFEIKELMEDRNVIECCRAVTKNKSIKPFFTKIIKDIAEIRKQKQNGLLKKALNARTMKLIKDAENRIERNRQQIRNYEEYLEEEYEKLDRNLAEKLGLETKVNIDDEGIKDILDFVERNKYINNLSLVKRDPYSDEPNCILLKVIAPINIYEIEPLQRQINNRVPDETYLHDLRDKIYKAFERIFIDEELTMLCETFVRLDLANGNVEARYNDVRKNTTDYERLMQPHLSFFNCWGDNSNGITTALRELDVTSAMNNIVIAAQNINFTDTTVLSRFIDAIVNSNYLYNLKTCLSKVDGKLWSISDIVEQMDRERATEEPSQKNNEEIGHPELQDTIGPDTPF